MPIRIGRFVALLAALVAVTAGGVSRVYQVTEIGPGRAHAINDAGTVVGETADDHAFAWNETDGVVDLHELLGLATSSSGAGDVNNRGAVIVGTPSGDSYVVSSRTGAFESLPAYLMPIAINDRGVILGGEMPAMLWDPHLGIEALTNLANADDINNRGQVLGTTSAAWDPTLPPGINVVVVGRNGELTLLGAYDASPGYPATVVRPGAITGSGVVVYSVAVYDGPGYPSQLTGYRWEPKSGSSEFPGLWLTAANNSGFMAGTTDDQRPVLVDRSASITYLPMPDGYRYAFVEDVNSSGVIVGSVTGPGLPGLAVMWEPIH